MIGSHLTDTVLWRETALIPEVLAGTVERAVSERELSNFYDSPDVRRIVATGNGAAYYVALSLQVASWLRPVDGLEVVAIPAGLLTTGHFSWRAGDRLLAISSSGAMSDVIAALDRDPVGAFGAITATPDSTIGTRATARALVEVATQDSPTHTQAYIGNLVAVLALWAHLSGDQALLTLLTSTPEMLETAIAAGPLWADEHIDEAGLPQAAIAFGSGPAWPAALETALLLKEVAAVPTEGMETREGATSGMYALDPHSLAVSISPSRFDPVVEATEDTCRGRGAAVIHLRALEDDHRLVAATVFPYAVALAARLGQRRGLDIDHPGWLDAYYATTRLAENEDTDEPGGSTD